MAKLWLTEEIITEVRRIGAFNDVESDGKADADIINALDIVMMDELVPSMVKLYEEYLVRSHDITLTANQEFIDIPSRAVANSLRDLYYFDASDNSSRYIPRYNRENRLFHSFDTATIPTGFYLEGDHIVLVPKSDGTGSLRVAYTFRPGQLVKADAYRKVTVIVSTTAVTVDSTVPTAWTTANIFDAHSSKSGAENRVFDYGASTVGGTGITFSAAIDGTATNTHAIEVGDYICLAETAAIPALPKELHPVLAQAAACRLLESDGDAVALEIARQTLARQIQSFNVLGESRVEGKPHKIVNRNSFLVRQTTRGGW